MKASRIEYLVDAGPLVGAFWPADQWHAWSRSTIGSLGAPLYTTETVVAEAAYRLRPCLPALFQLLSAVETGLVRFASILPEHTGRAAAIVRDYQPRSDLADASLVVLSELHPRAKLVTIDRRDFTVYRRNDGRPVPCIFPPASK